MSSSSLVNDLNAAVAYLQNAFSKHNLTPPTVIELGSHGDAAVILSAFHRDVGLTLPQPHMIEGHPRMVFKLRDIEFRYPAMRRALRSGGWEYV